MGLDSLSPIEVPWTMKRVESATTRVEKLDGRIAFRITHEVLAGGTPTMIQCRFNHMDGHVRIGLKPGTGHVLRTKNSGPFESRSKRPRALLRLQPNGYVADRSNPVSG